jgi:glucosamine--fructose-6-phosphate aminotransferase (isomerizing)
MCGIVAYIGKDSATEVIFDGLMRLEYRGYDSAGVAVHDGERISVAKSAGKIRDLRASISGRLPRATIGIGHTRWATHGRPSESNAHPHTSCDGKIAVVHNGIIENFLALREELTAKGHTFTSETDTEVIAHLVEDHFSGDLLAAVQAAARRLEGAYALGVLCLQEPNVVVGMRQSSPLIAGVGEGESFLASDALAVQSYTRRVIYLEDGEAALLTRERVRIFDAEGRPVDRPVHTVDWNPVAAERGGYEHFMLKEIHEQPEVIRNTVGGRMDDSRGAVYLPELGLSTAAIKGLQRIYFLACGSAYYAGLVGKYVVEAVSRIPCEVLLGSEFRYADPVLNAKTLAVAISQSGETADTLAALRRARDERAQAAAIVNVKGSTLTREVDSTVYMHAGPEVGVASTKVYTAMVAALELLAMHLGRERGARSAAEVREAIRELRAVPQLVHQFLKRARSVVRPIAKKYAKAENFLFLGRYVNYPTALEGALKLKEVSYIHAEGYAAGEMKHGPIALVDEKVPTLAIATQGRAYEKIVSNIKEVKARDGRVIALASEGDETAAKIADDVIYVPAVSELLSPLVNVVPLQLLAYYIADLRGADVDQPRNLAKSVTVE